MLFSHVRLLLPAGAVLLTAAFFAPVSLGGAEETKPTIEFAARTDEGGRKTMKIVIDNLPAEELTPDRLNALMEILKKTPADEAPGVKVRVKKNVSDAPVDRDQKQFDLELNIHWKRSVEDHVEDGGPAPPAEPASKRERRKKSPRREKKGADAPPESKPEEKVELGAPGILPQLQKLLPGSTKPTEDAKEEKPASKPSDK